MFTVCCDTWWQMADTWFSDLLYIADVKNCLGVMCMLHKQNCCNCYKPHVWICVYFQLIRISWRRWSTSWQSPWRRSNMSRNIWKSEREYTAQVRNPLQTAFINNSTFTLCWCFCNWVLRLIFLYSGNMNVISHVSHAVLFGNCRHLIYVLLTV